MVARTDAIDFDRENEQILASLDILAEYKAMGVVFPRERPKPNGVVECFAVGREETKPSAGVNVKTGRYFDMGGAHESMSFWDFAFKYANQGWSDWREARKFFAAKVGLEFANDNPRSASGGKSHDERLDSIRWLPWNAGNERITTIWGRTWKKGITLEAIKLAGGRFGEFPIWKNKETGEESGGEFKVIGVPAYDADKLNLSRPSCWVLWNSTGPHLPLHRGPGREPELIKMRTVGASRGTLMNHHALSQLAAGRRPDLIIKTGGPTDMLAILGAMPPEWRERIFVTTNASGETGEVVAGQCRVLDGLKVLCVGDRDFAGTVGVMRWLATLSGERRAVALPFELRPKHGQDARDFLGEAVA